MWKPFKSYSEKARKIISDNKYLALATSTLDGVPWAAVVFYAFDEGYNFYFLSAIDSRHIKDIEKNPKVSMVIFDSSSPIGVSDEVQMEGRVEEVSKSKRDIERVIEIYSNRLFPNSTVPAKERYRASAYTKPSEFRFYRIKVIATYTTGIDGKVSVNLLEK